MLRMVLPLRTGSQHTALPKEVVKRRWGCWRGRGAEGVTRVRAGGASACRVRPPPAAVPHLPTHRSPCPQTRWQRRGGQNGPSQRDTTQGCCFTDLLYSVAMAGGDGSAGPGSALPATKLGTPGQWGALPVPVPSTEVRSLQL